MCSCTFKVCKDDSNVVRRATEYLRSLHQTLTSNVRIYVRGGAGRIKLKSRMT